MKIRLHAKKFQVALALVAALVFSFPAIATGAPAHGLPKDAEREILLPVPKPGPNEAVVYVLASEVNFNDIWAITGIPVSPFDNHDLDYQVTGSGGVALVASIGSEIKREGRIKVGDLVTVEESRPLSAKKRWRLIEIVERAEGGSL